MNYFRACRAVEAFGQFTELVGHYWQALPAPKNDYFWASAQSESEGSWLLRQRIQSMLPQISTLTRELGIDTTFWSGSRAMGFLRLDMLAAITEDESRTHIPRANVADLLTRCGAAAVQEQRRAFWRLVIPVYWLVDIPALVLRFPFLVFRAAGLPVEWENTIAGHLFKVLELLAIVAIAARFGLQLDAVAKVLGR